MNQDLDERIVPNGEYREALNVKVTSSDDASVGVVQNILGNVRVDSHVPTDYVCIGTIADDKKSLFISLPLYCLYNYATLI